MAATPHAIKDLLRLMRGGMTAGRVAVEPLGQQTPPPVRHFLHDVADGVDFFATRFESATSRLAHSLLDSGLETGGDRRRSLAWLAEHPQGATVFAELTYDALGTAWRRFSERSYFVSETLAAQAFAQAMRRTAADRGLLPAELLVQITAHPVIRPVPPAPLSRDERTVIRRASIAFVLMLCTEWDADCAEVDLLDLCCDAAPYLDRQVSLSRDNLPALRSALAECARLI